MDMHEIAKKIEGLQTADSLAKNLNIGKRTAINYVSKLRKSGFIETIYGKRGIRMYRISPIRRIKTGYPGLYEFLNENSKIKIYPPYVNRIYDHKPTAEEMIVKAVQTGDFRTVLASLNLFSKIKNWALLGEISKKENIGRKIGALYDAARLVIRVRRMDERTRKSLLKSRIGSEFIIQNARTKDLKYIESAWNVHLPFNRADLEAYKE